MRETLIGRWTALRERLDGAGEWLAPLGLRLLLGWEFWEAGLQKLRGENWFGSIQGGFPFPFDRVPADLSWTLATWAELAGAIALWLGLGTRAFAFALLVLTAVATAAVHWPADWQGLGELWRGYAITDKGFGNFKLPLLFAAMLLPLALRGGGRLSLDAAIAAATDATPDRPQAGPMGWALGLALLGLPLFFLVPSLGLGLLAGALLLVLATRAIGH